MSSRLLVTGGAGFIGSNFIKYWLSEHKKDKIINIDKLTYAGDLENLSNVEENGNYSFVEGDISDYKLVDKLCRDVDIVINFAAESHVDNSIISSADFIKSNIIGVHALLEAVKKYDLRFHQISTDEVYGALELNSRLKFSESSPYLPKNPYSATKASADHIVRAYHNTYKLRVTISNCSNNYGPNQHPEKLIPKTILNALDNKQIPIYGDGLQVRDWIFVEDHCSAIGEIIENGKIGETYLVGADCEKHNIDVVKRVLDIMDKDQELIKFVADRPGHDVRYAIDASKIERELGWHPKYSFDQALRKTVEHYIEQVKRYKKKTLKYENVDSRR